MWLLRKEVADDLSRQYRFFDGRDFVFSNEQRDLFLAAFEPQRSETTAGPMLPRNATVDGDVMEICVEGVLTDKPNIFAWFFGGGNCTYESIRQALAVAKADPMIKRILWRIKSGGGHLAGLFETLAAIESMTKPMSVMSSEACSAAYAIAVLAGKIEATTIASEFGSIGVAQHFCFDNDETEIDLTSTDAPNKRPDVRTPEGKAVVVAELDAVHEIFAEAIARGRGTNVKNVNATYGRGAVFLAQKAKKLGMIDKIAKPMTPSIRTEPSMPAEDESPEASEDQRTIVAFKAAQPSGNHFVSDTAGIVAPKPVSAEQPQEPPAAPQAKPESSAGAEQNTRKGVRMDLATLMAQHPELYKQIVETAKAEGVTEGQTKERKRVAAHLKLGTKSGAMDVALKAIESGASPQDDDVFAEYQTAAMNRGSQAARQQDDAVAAAAIGDAGGAAPAAPVADLGDQVVALLKAQQNGIVLLPAKDVK